MGERRIAIKPFEMISILDYVGIQEVNEHGIVKVKGLIRAENKEEYIRMAAGETWVQILAYDDNGNESILFNGVLTDFSIQSAGNGCVMELILFTGTKLMDYKKHIKSFQKESYTYKQTVEICNESYSQSGVIMTEGKDSFLPGFVLQYEETDWEFLKRIASFHNTVIVPTCKVKGERYFFGLPDRKVMIEFDTEDYTVRQEAEEYTRKSAGGINIGKADAVSYIVDSREFFELGDKVSFQGMNLYVAKIQTSWLGNELSHKYYLKTKNGLKVIKSYLDDIIGLSLFGTVIAVKDERVKVSIRDDENPQSGNRWFSYSTVYSSPDGAGWYCMPETGDTVRLYFPSEDETNAYVISAFQENQGDGIRRNPDNKIWRNKKGKEIRITPDQILITNNKGMSVELSDRKGIKIVSDSSVSIKASDDICINSMNAGVELSASNSIVLRQGDTVMRMADGISFNGAKINLQ
ncbi:phage baseplate assembly protein V [Lacrimispora sp.]|uniref:phage baseplate assembly protein V n=1 Tax=Lacrimispora sp. TaxID=2719234 RepID=UPI0028AAF614|nr:phage baseplate assembly protein V [Lacrimispora sp.]